MKSLIIVNPADCIGCRTCEVACVVAHPSEQELNADVFLPRLKVQRLDSISAPVMCHQCENAPCVGACPVGASRWCRPILPVVLAVRAASVRARLG